MALDDVVVVHMDSHTGMSPDPISTTADPEKALLVLMMIVLHDDFDCYVLVVKFV